jgi:hypothetical protein
MPNSLFGPAPNQIPRNADLGELARLNTLPFRKLFFTTSQTWSPSRPVWANIYVTGGGGSAGANSTLYDGSTGGGAGGTAIKFGVLLLPWVPYTFQIGAGGAQAAVGGEGNPGSDSSFSGTNVPTLTGLGGKRGNRLPNGIATASSFVPAEGGLATGGDINLRGGIGTASMGVYPAALGNSVTGATAMLIAGPGGASFWGGNGSLVAAPLNYGEGAPGSGPNATSRSFAGMQGVIMLEFNE